ncbi:glycosyltransferase family 4 protein [Piscinibacter gummiphilus]|uniref:Glycosyltransferase family 4 protein n=1 Tax=Piscinibacter gummiphilus TaxID=946333 RepID=A0ABZ0CXW3_9BURK|nr:glycosyltransferase family 4 protein [Piscinibacter gummiphilus]WOB07319.1 glycosyltransferase family 4 protein [Piscinibacter gummiphilus]
MPTTVPQMLYIAPGDPWDRWTNSGTTVALIEGLQRNGRLFGALSRFDTDLKELHGRSATRQLMRRLQRKLGHAHQPTDDSLATDETSPLLAPLLRKLPEGSWVMYHYAIPKIDRSLPIKRVLFQDMTVDDAVRAGGFGWGSRTKEQIDASRAEIIQANKDADAIVSFGSFVADTMHAQYGIPKSKVFALGGGPIRRWDHPVPADLARYKKRQILFCGRAWERKGGPVLIEAFRKVRRELPDATLTVVSAGAPPLNEPGVEQFGHASDEKLHELYATASLFCMPSICESWGLVYVEAAAHGLPTANWSNWALPDIVDHNVTGVLSDRHDVDGLAEAIIEALRDPKHLMDMGQNAVKRVRDVLDWPHCVDRLLAATMPDALQGREPVWMRPR